MVEYLAILTPSLARGGPFQDRDSTLYGASIPMQQQFCFSSGSHFHCKASPACLPSWNFLDLLINISQLLHCHREFESSSPAACASRSYLVLLPKTTCSPRAMAHVAWCPNLALHGRSTVQHHLQHFLSTVETLRSSLAHERLLAKLCSRQQSGQVAYLSHVLLAPRVNILH